MKLRRDGAEIAACLLFNQATPGDKPRNFTDTRSEEMHGLERSEDQTRMKSASLSLSAILGPGLKAGGGGENR